MTRNFDLALVQRLFSDCPRVEKLPSIDAIVCEFLRIHDVHVQPVSSNTSPSRATNAMMGAISPVALAANTAITQQQKGAALQEWTTWKQWALSHADFPAFKERIKERANQSAIRQDDWLLANKDRIRKAVVAHHEKMQKEQQTLQRFIIAFIGIVSLLLVGAGLVSEYSPKTLQPAVVQSK